MKARIINLKMGRDILKKLLVDIHNGVFLSGSETPEERDLVIQGQSKTYFASLVAIEETLARLEPADKNAL